MRIKIDPLDQLFSKVVRLRADGKCQRCLKVTEFNRLQCCHFHGRANKKVRWDLTNAIACDYGCHAFIDSRPMDKWELFKKVFGEAEIEKLNQRANWRDFKKPDKKAIESYLKFKLKEYELTRIENC